MMLPGQIVRGSIEPHAAILKQPPPGSAIYKVMAADNFVSSVASSSLYFNRVDSYKDFPDADPNDGAELPIDHAQNARIAFTRGQDFTVSEYYGQSRARTYATCFSMENSAYIWKAYGTGGAHGKVGLVCDFHRLRTLLNRNVQQAIENDLLMYEGQQCHQIFSINYGLVEYVNREQHRAGDPLLANPIAYTFIKDKRYEAEKELRVSMSALGFGHFALRDGRILEFPKHLPVHLDFKEAFAVGAIQRIEAPPETDIEWLAKELAALGIRTGF